MEQVISVGKTVKTIGEFGFSTLTRCNHKLVEEWKHRDLLGFMREHDDAHRGTYEDICRFWGQFGAVWTDHVSSHNRLVNSGLQMLVDCYVAAANVAAAPGVATLGTKIQIGTDGVTGWNAAARVGGCVAPYGDTNGFQLGAISTTVISAQVSGQSGVYRDIVRAARTFQVGASVANYNDPGEGVEEAAIVNTAGTSAYAYTTVTPERLMSSVGDQLVVTYNSRIIP